MITFLILWYIAGLAGSVLIMEFAWRRGPYPLDIEISDIIFGSLMAVLGFLNFFIGVVFFLFWVVRNIFGVLFPKFKGNTVIFKAKR